MARALGGIVSLLPFRVRLQQPGAEPRENREVCPRTEVQRPRLASACPIPRVTAGPHRQASRFLDPGCCPGCIPGQCVFSHSSGATTLSWPPPGRRGAGRHPAAGSCTQRVGEPGSVAWTHLSRCASADGAATPPRQHPELSAGSRPQLASYAFFRPASQTGRVLPASLRVVCSPWWCTLTGLENTLLVLRDLVRFFAA